jgi:outer membrane protein assembly factor BamB
MTKLQKRGARIAALSLATTFAIGLASAPAFAGGEKVTTREDGMQVAIDRATGKLRQPTASEARTLGSPIAAKSGTTGLQFTTWPDGTASAVLTEDYLNVWLVQLDANGSASQVCVDGANATSTTPAAPVAEEK